MKQPIHHLANQRIKTMNSKQIKAAQTVTKREYIEWKTCKYIGGELTFTMDEIGDKVFIQGSNTQTKHWFDTHFIVQFFIGPKGGVKVKVKTYPVKVSK
jgi:hypothetical protein